MAKNEDNAVSFGLSGWNPHMEITMDVWNVMYVAPTTWVVYPQAQPPEREPHMDPSQANHYWHYF